MSEWFLLFTLMAMFAMTMTKIFNHVQYKNLFESRIKSAIIITIVVALLVAGITEWLLQRNGDSRFLDHTIFMFVSYLGALIWWLTLRFIRPW